jgi:hypothetical protein
MQPELGILLADGASFAAALARIERPESTQLFLMDDAVLLAHDERLRALADAGAEVTLCAADAQARGVAVVEGGPRFGSQDDHASLLRTCSRLVAFTGAAPTEMDLGEQRRVGVILTREPRHPKTAQGLRTAVGYLAGRLEVALLVEPQARSLLDHDDHPAQVARALATIRALGRIGGPTDLEIAW